MTFNGSTLAVTGNLTTTSSTSNSVGGMTLSNSVMTVPTGLFLPWLNGGQGGANPQTYIYAGAASPNQTVTRWGDGTGWQYNFLGNSTRTSNVLTLVDNGAVGINCNPGAGIALDVNGNIRTTTTTTSNSIGGSTLSNSILTVGAATAGSTTSGSVNVAGGYFVNGVALATGGGSTISGTTTTGTVLLATGTSTGLQGSSNLTFSNGSNLGIQTTTPVTALDVNGGVTIRNGYRPTYSNVSSGTSLTISANTYGTHFNITTSALTGITLPTVTGSTDSNAYWVFRNNTAGYLSITFTYTTAGTTYPANPVTIPPANSLTMMVTFPSSVLGYVLF
jgi:hypothetical protein